MRRAACDGMSRLCVSLLVSMIGLSSLGARAESSPQIVLIGDSLVARGNWTKLLRRDDVVNRGMEGDTIRGVTRRLRHLGPLRPAQVVVMVGINDLIGRRTVEACVGDMRRLLGRLRETAPDARVIVSSVLPVGDSLDHLSSKIEALAQRYRALCSGGSSCTYLDVRSEFRAHHLHSDDLHLSAAGYAHWAEVLQREVR